MSVSCENQWGDTTPANYSAVLARQIIEKFGSKLSDMKVLDLNADTGRLAFELAPYVKELTAIDFSARFIRLPIQLQERGFMRYIVKDENDLVFYREVVLTNTSLGEGCERIKFMQDNANNLKPIYKGYDLIILPNVLEEISCPVKFLSQIHTRLNPGGWLVIASDYNWEAQNVESDCRPGGFKQDGEPVTSSEGIAALLSPHFIQVDKPVDIYRYERISSRKMIVRTCEVTSWKYRG